MGWLKSILSIVSFLTDWLRSARDRSLGRAEAIAEQAAEGKRVDDAVQAEADKVVTDDDLDKRLRDGSA